MRVLKFEVRKQTLVNFKDKDVELIHPEQTVVMLENSKSDIGRVCFTKRQHVIRVKDCEVVLSSFDKRRLKTASLLAEDFLNENNFDTAKTKFNDRIRFFDFIDDNLSSEVDFQDYQSLVTAYKKYSKHLEERVSAGAIVNRKNDKIDKMAPRYAAVLQSAARKVISFATGVKGKQIKLTSHIVLKETYKDRAAVQAKLARTHEDVEYQFNCLRSFVDMAYEVLVNNKHLPYSFTRPIQPNGYFHPAFVTNADAWLTTELIARDSIMDYATWSSYIRKYNAGLTELEIKRKSSSRMYNISYTDSYQASLDKYSTVRKRLANHAMRAAAGLFAMATGTDATSVRNVEVNTLEFSQTTKSWRTSGTKLRAKGRTVFPEFGVRFVPIMQKILDLRQYVLRGLCMDSKWIFVKFVLTTGSEKLAKGALARNSPTSLLLNNLYENFNWVLCSEARDHRVLEINKLAEGDIEKSSSLSDHSVEVERKSYLKVHPDDAHKELSSFVDSVYCWAKDKTRTKNKIDVAVLDADKGDEIPAGQCNELNNAHLLDGFTEHAPQPDCRKFENCLFCDKYAVHADETDIRRLLSIRYLAANIRGSRGTLEDYESRWGTIIYRIDEILDEISSALSDESKLIEEISKEVEESEELDEFWSIHLDALIDIGVVT